MNRSGRSAFAIFSAGVWINMMEFVRNEVLVRSYWTRHYSRMGMSFPSETVNAIGWVVWGFCLAAGVYILSRKFGLLGTTVLAWFMSFLMMWIAIWNLAVLPEGLLLIALPLSLLEVLIAAVICRMISPVSSDEGTQA